MYRFNPHSFSLSPLRGRAGRALEEGGLDGPLARAAARAWAGVAARRVARPVVIPAGLGVVAIGGATLGGAGKTPVAIAVAGALAAREPVVLVAHAYGASPRAARVVGVLDDPDEVGDDALTAARALPGSDAIVVVAPTRGEALAFAARRARLVVVDGLLQASPRRVDDAVLVLDGAAPWGVGRCPPAGDLRAPIDALLAAADHVVALGAAPGGPGLPLPVVVERADSPAAGEVRLTELAGRPVGVALAVAHPERVLRSLAAANIRPSVVVRLADHARFDAARLAAHRVEAWLTTARCATKLPEAIGPAPVFALRHEVDVGPLVARLAVRA